MGRCGGAAALSGNLLKVRGALFLACLQASAMLILSPAQKDVNSCLSFTRYPAIAMGFLLLPTIPSEAVDLGSAVIVYPATFSGPEKKAVQMLAEEAEKRSKVLWPATTIWPSSNGPVIAVCTKALLPDFAPDYAKELAESPNSKGPEGFQISVKRGATNTVVLVVGNDARGVLFGVGKLLREMRLQPGRVSVADNLDIATAPKYPLRGHQLGYRPKSNSYDAWDLPVWEQYFRDLAVFGCNSIELIPPRSDDAATSPHFPRPPMEMIAGMSRIADSYGLDVWVWYPAMDNDYSDPKTVELALHEWGEVFANLPRIDDVFVPGGDPGHTRPKFLMALLEKQTENLHRYHPKARMWVSPQGFDQAWMDEFLDILKRDQPAWLSGLVFGPQVRLSLPRLRELAPRQYPIRHYPDITHSRQCQFPAPDWDAAYAVTEARECINPRPEDEAVIFRKMQPDTIGFLTYSEGCNDDVNKMIWSGLGWDPEQKVADILREYSRYFIGDRFTETFAEGLLALENNWRGPLLANAGVEKTLAHFQALEREASPADLRNWRFQQAMFRAYYDASVRERLISETEIEGKAMEVLGRLMGKDTLEAMVQAEKQLNVQAGSSNDTRILLLGEALFQTIGMQLSVEKYKALAVDRGASLDTLDYPLNNRDWLRDRFASIRKLRSEEERREALQRILNWTNAGPGGFYDDLGNPAQEPHLVRGPGFREDPAAVVSARADFEEDEDMGAARVARRMSWIDHAESLYDAPLQMRYTGLDNKASYKIRVVYGGDDFEHKIRLVANEGIEIHPFIAKPYPIKPIEFAIPLGVIKNGELILTWSGEPGLGGNGRTCQVSEVWLIKD
jgi:hypothetical protein